MARSSRSGNFKHFICHRYDEAEDGLAQEIFATDGSRIRRLGVYTQHISFQDFESTEIAAALVAAIEDPRAQKRATGYRLLKDEATVGMVHTAEHLNPGWLTFPIDETPLRLPRLRLQAAEAPTLRLVGGMSVGGDFVTAVLEQRGQRFAQSNEYFNILEHIKGWSVRQDSSDLRPTVADSIASDFEANWETLPGIGSAVCQDEQLSQTFQLVSTSGLATESFSLLLEFDRELFCLPREWLTFSISLELGQ